MSRIFISALILGVLISLFGLTVAPALAQAPVGPATERAVLTPQPIPGPLAKNKSQGLPDLAEGEYFIKFNQINEWVKVADPDAQAHDVCLLKSTPWTAVASYDGQEVNFGLLVKIFKLSKKVDNAKLTVYSNGLKIGWKKK